MKSAGLHACDNWIFFSLPVDRAVKYSGFGNFVGFLSRHGLMAPSGSRSSGDAYSSTSSDSETEDYRELKDQINPVTGRVEPPHRNPMEGLSDEQKEFEAMQLVNKIDQLQRLVLSKSVSNAYFHHLFYLFFVCFSPKSRTFT